jgi:hypothetical protein
LGWSTDRVVRVEALVERLAPSRTFDWPALARSRVAFAIVVLRPLASNGAEDPPLRATRRILVDVDGIHISDDFAPVTTAVVAFPTTRPAAPTTPRITAGDWQRWDSPPTHVVVTMDAAHPTQAVTGDTTKRDAEVQVLLGDVVVASARRPASARGRWTSPPMRIDLSMARWRDPTARDAASWRVQSVDTTTRLVEPAPVTRIVWWRESTTSVP